MVVIEIGRSEGVGAGWPGWSPGACFGAGEVGGHGAVVPRCGRLNAIESLALPAGAVCHIETMATPPRHERIRIAVVRASDAKRLRGGQGAREELEQALRLAANTNAAPWDAIAAYRLAHLIMRDARTENDLQNAEALFLDASKQAALGPWPAVYHVAVLHRLGKKARARQAFDKARTLIGEALGRDPSDPPDREAADDADPTLQHALVNVLELCSYMIDAPHDGLDGLGALPFEFREGAPRRRGWALLSARIEELAGASSVVLTDRALAGAELTALRERHPAALVFELPREGRGTLWRPGHPSGDAVDSTQLRMLADALRSARPDDTSLRQRQRILGEEAADEGEGRAGARLRKVRERLRARLHGWGIETLHKGVFPAETPVIGLLEE